MSETVERISPKAISMLSLDDLASKAPRREIQVGLILIEELREGGGGYLHDLASRMQRRTTPFYVQELLAYAKRFEKLGIVRDKPKWEEAPILHGGSFFELTPGKGQRFAEAVNRE